MGWMEQKKLGDSTLLVGEKEMEGSWAADTMDSSEDHILGEDHRRNRTVKAAFFVVDAFFCGFFGFWLGTFSRWHFW